MSFGWAGWKSDGARRHSASHGFPVRLARSYMPPYPLIQDKQAPWTRPRCAPLQKFLPHAESESAVDVFGKSGRPLHESLGDALAQRAAQPIAPRESEGSLRPRNDLRGQNIF